MPGERKKVANMIDEMYLFDANNVETEENKAMTAAVALNIGKNLNLALASKDSSKGPAVDLM